MVFGLLKKIFKREDNLSLDFSEGSENPIEQSSFQPQSQSIQNIQQPQSSFLAPQAFIPQIPTQQNIQQTSLETLKQQINLLMTKIDMLNSKIDMILQRIQMIEQILYYKR